LRGGLRILGDVVNAGTVAPGNSPDITTIIGDYVQLPGSTLEIEVGGLTPGTEHDMLVVTGTATLGGQLVVPLIDGYDPPVDDPSKFITILTAGGGLVGTFTGEPETPNSDYDVHLVYWRNSVELIFSQRGFSRLYKGDMDGNDVVDQDDWDDFARALRDPEAYDLSFGFADRHLEAGDFDHNGLLDFDDIDKFAQYVSGSSAGASYETVLAAISQHLGIPEPSSALLISLGCLLLIVTGRRHK
jgi:hypothetical protein